MKQQNKKEYYQIEIKVESSFGEVLAKQEIASALKSIDKKEIVSGEVEKEVLKEALWCISEHTASKLNSYMGADSMLLSISHISFPKLTRLDLRFSKICGIQVIPRICMPLLEKLWLNGNYIATLRPLRRASITFLKKLGIFDNKLRTCSSLSEAEFTILHTISVAFEQKAAIEDLRDILKLNSTKMQTILALKKQNICQLNIIQQFGKKYLKVSVQHN